MPLSNEMKASKWKLKLDLKLLIDILHRFVVQHHVPLDKSEPNMLPPVLNATQLVEQLYV